MNFLRLFTNLKRGIKEKKIAVESFNVTQTPNFTSDFVSDPSYSSPRLVHRVCPSQTTITITLTGYGEEAANIINGICKNEKNI